MVRPKDSYRVNEIFTSVQGEGGFAGTPATFIRLQGCSVGCPWCDTKYTWEAGGEWMTVNDIVVQAKTRHVVITGGEPTLWDLDPLLKQLGAEMHYVQLETSGQNSLKGNLIPNWITWSPKANLKYQAASDIRSQAREVKWVVDTELTWEIVWSTWLHMKAGKFVPPLFVLMPEGTPPAPDNIAKALSWLPQVPFSAQMHWQISDRLQYRLNVK